MGWYRRSRVGFDAFSRYFTSKITAANAPIKNPLSRIDPYNRFTPPVNNPTRVSMVSLFSPVSTNKSLDFRFGTNWYRHYYVDRHHVRHFKARGFKRWFDNPRTVLMVVLIGSGVGITIYFANIETIPYTKRRHVVLLSPNMEKSLGESQFKEMKAAFKGKILPAMHPESVRVRMIAKDIIEALQRGLKREQVWTDLDYASEHSAGVSERKGREALVAMTEDPVVGDRWRKDDEVLDDRWVEKSRKRGKEKGQLSATLHLEGLKWEVLVVNEPVVNAFCLPGGKIVVFTGLLEHFRTDAEIATIIGHEVAHAVARHAAEQITKNLWFAIVQLILFQFIMPDVVTTMSHLLLRLPFSRRMEIEADYIGLLLMASAGYDPRVAPKVFEKLGKISGDSALRDYLSTHPSGKTRSKLLSEATVMQEALAIYRESLAGREVDGFFL